MSWREDKRKYGGMSAWLYGFAEPSVAVAWYYIILAMKSKQKAKASKQSKKRQLLSVFHLSVPFLQLLTAQQLDYLEDRLHIFVFTRGQCLAKEKEFIDYLGVIVEGRAVSKGNAYQVGDLIGHTQILALQSTHGRTINAESDGVIIAIRIVDFLNIEKVALKNKMISRMVEVHVNQLLKRDEIHKQYEQYETVEEKKVGKFLAPEWSNFFSQEMDAKEKSKFFAYFPFYKLKQKDIVANTTSRPSLFYLVQGQLVAKVKQDSRVIQSGSLYNTQGFIFNQNSAENVYCLSSQAIVLVIDKAILVQNFKMETFRALMKILTNQVASSCKKMETPQEIEGREAKSWSIFRKYPNAEILPLPKKNENLKTTKPTSNNPNELAHLNAFQTLFREQLGASTKEKTGASMAESGYDKLYTLKTESAGKEVQTLLQLQKLRKEVDLLSEKLKLSQEISKINKLELIENRSRVGMSAVFKQIGRLYQQGDIIRANGQKQQDSQMGVSCLTLKQALDKQMKESKTQMLVARCAFKWLYLTRKRKGGKKE